MSTWLLRDARGVRVLGCAALVTAAASAWAGPVGPEARRAATLGACTAQALASAPHEAPERTQLLAPGVTFSVLRGEDDSVLLENTSRHAVIVLDEDGEPLLRIGRKGVEANVRSRAWRTSGACAATTVDRGPSFVGTPSWQRVARAPRFRWSDPRVSRIARDDADARWHIPVLLGTQAVELTGDLRPRPFQDVAGISLRAR